MELYRKNSGELYHSLAWVTDGYSKHATLQLADRLGVLGALAQACTKYIIGIKLRIESRIRYREQLTTNPLYRTIIIYIII